MKTELVFQGESHILTTEDEVKSERRQCRARVQAYHDVHDRPCEISAKWTDGRHWYCHIHKPRDAVRKV